MVTSGLNLAWTLFNSEFVEQKWYKNATTIEVLAVQCSWFVGSIVGGFNAGYFADSMGRNKVIVSIIILYCRFIFKMFVYDPQTYFFNLTLLNC